MSKFSSKLLLNAMLLFSRQPWIILHFESRVIALFMTFIVGYRKKVVRGNLMKVYGVADLEYEYYKNFCDVTIETIKMFTDKSNSVLDRMHYDNTGLELMKKLYQEGKHVIIVGGHFSNWEMLMTLTPRVLDHFTMSICKKLNDEIINVAMNSSREKWGLEVVEMAACKTWMDNKVVSSVEPIGVISLFDQSPANANKAWWTTFLGVQTPVYFGIEKWARKYDAAVVYSTVSRVGRGKYKVGFELITDNVNEMIHGEIIDRCLGVLEKEVIKSPAEWLWSHKRWKLKKPVNADLQPRRFSEWK